MPVLVTVQIFVRVVKVTAALRGEDLRRGGGDLGGEQTRRPEGKE
jgi:hypothetical protein